MPTSFSAHEPHRKGAPTWLLPVGIFATLLLVFASTIVDTGQVCLDVWSANYASWHLVHTGHPWIEGLSIPYLDTNQFRDVWVMPGPNGHTVIGRSPGVIAASLPLYALLRPAHMTIVPAGYTAAILTAAAATFLYLALARETSRTRAAAGSLAFALTTPVWSIAANGLWPHTLTVFGIAGMAWASGSRRYWLMGVFGGVALWGRVHAAFILAITATLLALRRRDPRIVLMAGSVGALFLALSTVWIHWMDGTWDPLGYQSSGPATVTVVGRGMWGAAFMVNELGLWVSPDRGILAWTPVVLLLLPALIRSWRTLPDWTHALVYAGLSYTLLQGKINVFMGGDPFYGYRLGLEMLACLAPALVLSTERMGSVARHLLAPVLVAQFWVISIGAINDNYFVFPDQAWHDNAFLVAVRGNPGGVLGVLVALVLVTVVVQETVFRRIERRRADGQVTPVEITLPTAGV